MARSMSDVGNETQADTKGAGLDTTRSRPDLVGKASLAHAVSHLQAEHPIAYDDLGPHHGERGMTKHLPLAGMKPGGKI